MMFDALMPSYDAGLTSYPQLQQIQQWAGRAATPITLLLVSAVLGSILKWTRRNGQGKTNHHPPLPPTPGTALPLVGHLHLLKNGGGDPRVMFAEMRKKLGDIFSFYCGNRLVVVLNGYDVIREALVKKAAVFSHRAETFMSQQMGQGKGILNTSGAEWLEHRQFMERAFRSLGVGQSSNMDHKIQVELTHLLGHLDRPGYQGQPVDLAPLLRASLSNVIISIIYGHRFDLDDPTYQTVLDALHNCFANFGNTEPLNFFPSVRFLPGDPCSYWSCIENMNTIENNLVYPEIDKHEKSLDDVDNDDVVSTYLREMAQKKKSDAPTYMNKEHLVKVAGDILAGGSETPSATVLWFLLYMVRHPHVQEKCYQELLDHVGKDRSPTLDDRSRLPFLEATILETQRHADVGFLAVAHGLSRDTEFRGFHLPQDAIVLVNIHSVHHEVEAWGDPEVFRPERFLGEDGRVKRHPYFIPYSLGPRACPGEQMSRMELFLYTSTILQRYRLSHPGSTPPPLEGRLTLIHNPAPFSLVLEKRV